MADKNWKKNERGTAKYIGGERVPITGRQRGDVPDIKHKWLAPECKLRKTIPGWILEGMEQAKAASRGHQLPVLIIRQSGQSIEDSLICMPLKEFRDRWL
jgi:hypothetical protein